MENVTSIYPNIFSHCRICLQTTSNGARAQQLFSQHQISKDILEKIYVCFQIVINCEDTLPRVICQTCVEELNMANLFRIKCVTFEERFAEICKQMESKVPILFMDSKSEEFECSADAEFSSALNCDNTTEKRCDYTKYECDICHKLLKTKGSLMKHVVSMHQKRKHIGNIVGSGVNRRYQCTKCSYSTPHSQTLVNHMRRHNGERPYRCKCGKAFTQSASLAAHQKTHSNSFDYTCSTCGKQFKHAYALKKHQQVHANGAFTCNICQKHLKSQKSLNEHTNRHYNIRNYNCEDCGATFVTSADLLNHRVTHSKEKKIECHLCAYKTHTKQSMALHLKRHTGDKMYKCEVCEVAAYTGSELRRHGRVHSREKPYPCRACAQRFAHSSSLNKHMRLVHGIQYKWSETKTMSCTSKGVKHEF